MLGPYLQTALKTCQVSNGYIKRLCKEMKCFLSQQIIILIVTRRVVFLRLKHHNIPESKCFDGETPCLAWAQHGSNKRLSATISVSCLSINMWLSFFLRSFCLYICSTWLGFSLFFCWISFICTIFTILYMFRCRNPKCVTMNYFWRNWANGAFH